MANIVAHWFAALLATGVSVNTTGSSLGFPLVLQQSGAQYAPWFPGVVYELPPSGCDVVQVNLLQRHGTWYPGKHANKAIRKSVKRLKRAKRFKAPELAFVEKYKYTLGTDDLASFEAAQSFDAGQEHFVRYAALVNEYSLPFVRASESDYVIDSAGNWSAGFAYASKQKYFPNLSVMISQSGSDRLDDRMCPQVGRRAKEIKAWRDAFAPAIAKRINALAPGAKLKKKDVVNLMTLCPFDTLARETPSPWCDLFTPEEWASYGYYGNPKDYYGSGYGYELESMQGVGYVNDLLARLTGQPVQDEAQTSHTANDSLITFPRDRTFYADFSYVNQMISIYSVLGLFMQPHDLNPTQDRTWKDASLVPFSGRMITEKIVCDGSSVKMQGEYVRVLVNDVVQSLAFCGAYEDGLCTLADFVESQSYAQEGDWVQCFEGQG